MTEQSDILPPGLYEAVLERVARAQRRAARVRFMLLAGLSCALTVLSALVLQYALHEAGLSGFGSYASLLLSDGTLVFTRDFALSLVESLPSLAVLMLVVLGAALAWSLARAWRSGKQAFAYV